MRQYLERLSRKCDNNNQIEDVHHRLLERSDPYLIYVTSKYIQMTKYCTICEATDHTIRSHVPSSSGNVLYPCLEASFLVKFELEMNFLSDFTQNQAIFDAPRVFQKGPAWAKIESEGVQIKLLSVHVLDIVKQTSFLDYLGPWYCLMVKIEQDFKILEILMVTPTASTRLSLR